MAPWPFLRIAAHRGSGTMLPRTRSKVSVRASLRFQSHGTDAMLAKDGVPVLMHDEKFGRTILDDDRSVPN